MTTTPTTHGAERVHTGELRSLLTRLEEAEGPSDELDKLIALSIGGWHRYTPSQIRMNRPGWISPEDYLGEYEDGRPRFSQSYDGATIHRRPPAYTASLDAALALVEEKHAETGLHPPKALSRALDEMDTFGWRNDQPLTPQLCRYVLIALLKGLGHD